jgi:superfamily II DNA/RNA helicase
LSTHTHSGVRPGLSFASLGLPDSLVQRLARDGITQPFAIQAAAIPDALAGRDVLGRGQTGSGKTLAFGLPMLARLEGRTAKPRKPLAIVLVPTRELAMQVHDALMPLAHVVGVKIRLIAGGLSYTKQISGLERGVELVVATPGRLADLVERGSCDLREVEVAVLDEADHMAEMGFLPAITELLDMIPVGGQRLLFSATLDRGVDGVVARYLIDPVTHATESATASVTTMDHHILHVEPNHKAVVTAEIASREGRTVIFVRTKLGADRVAGQLRQQGVAAAALHGGLAQGARNAVLNAFKEGTLPVLVATDVAARGIHVDDIGLVLQVDPPTDHKDYLHRAGRTARAGGRGTVVTLALPHQRKAVERMTAQAGIEVRATLTRPGDEALAKATGARTPEGAPVSDEDVRRLTHAPRERGERAGRPARFGGPRRSEGGPRREGGPRSGGPRRTEGGPRRTEGGPRRTEGGPARANGGPRRTEGGGPPRAGGGKRFDGNRFDGKPSRSR